jgi:glutathione peroxidase-family protein
VDGACHPLAFLVADHLSGFTPQYTGLEELYKTYHDQGLEVLGFPSNEFGGQEPGSDEDIASFCTVSAMSFLTSAIADIDPVASSTTASLSPS